MKTSYITNLLLLIFIIGLYWFLNKEAPIPIENPNISSLNATDVSTITIHRQNRNDIILNKTNDNWLISQPIQAEANTTRVNLILNLLTVVSHKQFTPDSKTSLKQFDLDPAPISVQLNDQFFKFGDIEPLNKHRYIQHNSVIHLIDDTVAPLLNSTAASFINNRLIPKGHDITKITLPNLTLSLDNGHWESDNVELFSDTLTATISAWQHAYALQVIPLSTEELSTQRGQNISLEFSKHETVEYLLQFDSRSLSLVDHAKKLKYQFPIAIKQQFIPEKDK